MNKFQFVLSLDTLMLVSVVPFIYFAYHVKYARIPDKVRMYDTLLVMICGALACVVFYMMYQDLSAGNRANIKISVLHLGPLLSSLLIAAKPKNFGPAARGGAPAAGKQAAAAQTDATGFDPKPLEDTGDEMTWDDLIISEDLKKELMSVVELLKDIQKAKKFGIDVPKGILLQGPPGTGKTTIARVVANMSGLSFFVLRSNEIVSKWVGESEKNLTKLFEAANKHAPSVIFIDEVDALGKAREGGSGGGGVNLLNHLLQCIDGVVKSEGLYIIAATNRADMVDEALKRPGRLNKVIEIPLPDYDSRKKLFQIYLKKLHLTASVDIENLARITERLPAAAIKEICNQAGLNAFKRQAGSKSTNYDIMPEDLESALGAFVKKDDDDLFDKKKKTDDFDPQPLNSQIEKMGWKDLIIDEGLKGELESVIKLLKDPSTAKEYGIDVPKGILLNGPPGTGKTTIAKVVANMAQCNFFVLQTDQIVSQWVGQSEKNLTKLFKAAQKHAPAIIFIDEVDSIAKNRSGKNAAHSDNLLNHLLQLIDGVVKAEGLYVIAATNRADMVDPALKRGGRLNRTIEIPLPNLDARLALFNLYLSKLKLAEDLDVGHLAMVTEGKAAADIRAICNQAGLNAYKRESATGSRKYIVQTTDMQNALRDFKAEAT